jgi:Tat protein secretion system quality control protein TatD with DNase activity
VHTISLDSSTPKELHYRQLLLDPNPSSALEAAFSSLLSTLPDPIPLQEALSTLRANLLSFPHAFLGEVGLDRAFRLPSHLPQQDNRRRLSPFSTPLAHQIAILEAQLNLAVELQRNVSLHSVKSGMATVELLVRMKQKWTERWWKIGVDMHSCGLSVETWLDIEACPRRPPTALRANLVFG